MSFTAKNQALLFAWIARAAIAEAGAEKALPVLKDVVVEYAHERGSRMAAYTLRDGRPLTMASYCCYGEWKAGEGEMVQQFVSPPPDVNVHITKCPWNDAWKENNLAEYGKLFCAYVDKALVEAYNNSLKLEINGTLSQGDEYCDFIFCGISPSEMLPAKENIVKPWEYHTGHLLSTAMRVLHNGLGEYCSFIRERVVYDYSQYFGESSLETLLEYSALDFNEI